MGPAKKRFLTVLRPRHLLSLSRWPLALDRYILFLQTHSDAAKERLGVGALREVRRGIQRNSNERDQDADQGLCAFGCPAFVYRNVERLNNHLAAPLKGLGKSSGFKHATSAALDVQAKYAEELASRAAGKATKKKTEEHHSAV
jgi:hypothetical protein